MFLSLLSLFIVHWFELSIGVYVLGVLIEGLLRAISLVLGWCRMCWGQYSLMLFHSCGVLLICTIVRIMTYSLRATVIKLSLSIEISKHRCRLGLRLLLVLLLWFLLAYNTRLWSRILLELTLAWALLATASNFFDLRSLNLVLVSASRVELPDGKSTND